MKVLGFILISFFLLAGVTQAVNTVATLNDRSRTSSQEGLIGDVTAWNQGAAHMLGPSPDVPEAADVVLEAILGDRLDLSVGEVASSVEPGTPCCQDGGVIDAGIWSTAHRRSADSRRNSNVDFVKANSSVSLPAFAEIDWMSMPLQSETETSLMETLVFPALGGAVLVFFAGALFVQLRRRRAAGQVQQLIQV